MRLLHHRRLHREVLERRSELLDLRLAAGLDRVERARAEERQLDVARPTDVRVDAVLERGPCADERTVLRGDVHEIPVQPSVEPGREACGCVRGQHRGREQHRVDPVVADELGERVDARLRERRLELGRFSHVDLLRPEPARPGRETLHVRAE